MTQQQIADSLGVSQQAVGFRIRYSKFPTSVIDTFTTRVSLNERHARELLGLLPGSKEWLSTEQILLEIIDNILGRTKEPTSVLDQFITKDSLKEGHARELLGLLQCNNQWLTTEQILMESVGFRIQYSEFPTSVIDAFGTKDSLKEGHARELLGLVQCTKEWLTTDLMHFVL